MSPRPDANRDADLFEIVDTGDFLRHALVAPVLIAAGSKQPGEAAQDAVEKKLFRKTGRAHS